jgi:hypothetical protein
VRRIVASDNMDFRERLSNARAGQVTGAPTETSAPKGLREGPLGRVAHHVTG